MAHRVTFCLELIGQIAQTFTSPAQGRLWITAYWSPPVLTGTRQAGAGRKRIEAKDATLLPDLLARVDSGTRGDPESALRWTCKSLRNLADE